MSGPFFDYEPEPEADFHPAVESCERCGNDFLMEELTPIARGDGYMCDPCIAHSPNHDVGTACGCLVDLRADKIVQCSDGETWCLHCATDRANRVYQSVHGQELVRAERRTRERVRVELAAVGLEDYYETLVRHDRPSEIVQQLKAMGL